MTIYSQCQAIGMWDAPLELEQKMQTDSMYSLPLFFAERWGGAGRRERTKGVRERKTERHKEKHPNITSACYPSFCLPQEQESPFSNSLCLGVG